MNINKHDYRCVPFWTGSEWWCPHTETGRTVIDTDVLAEMHYHTSMELMMTALGVPD